MKIPDGNKVLFSVLLALFLGSCAAPEKSAPERIEMVPGLPVVTDSQYMCVSKVYLSDVTKAFLLPVADGGDGGNVEAGKLLDKAVQGTFWTDASAKVSGRVPPVVTLGFDGATGVYTDPNSGKYFVQISLQFQIFKPTGQSYMDVAVGQSSAPASGHAGSEAAIQAAMAQALHRLEGILVSAQICRPMQ